MPRISAMGAGCNAGCLKLGPPSFEKQRAASPSRNLPPGTVRFAADR
jgi:hypothetical protein